MQLHTLCKFKFEKFELINKKQNKAKTTKKQKQTQEGIQVSNAINFKLDLMLKDNI